MATYSQSGSTGHHLVRYLKAAGELGKLKGLITIDGVGTTFANSGTTAEDYRNIPHG